ncbi:putative iSPsy21, transposase OrfB [Burkholderia cepacia]|nr:putative iSPsy21, transposase OrfB [Burkholderia cepacia]
MNRADIAAARSTIGRLMKLQGLRGAIRGKRIRTTTPDTSAPRPLDRGNRQFKAERPNQLWVSDFTYVSAELGYVAFVNPLEPLGYIPPAEAEANYYRQLRNAADVPASACFNTATICSTLKRLRFIVRLLSYRKNPPKTRLHHGAVYWGRTPPNVGAALETNAETAKVMQPDSPRVAFAEAVLIWPLGWNVIPCNRVQGITSALRSLPQSCRVSHPHNVLRGPGRHESQYVVESNVSGSRAIDLRKMVAHQAPAGCLGLLLRQ